jgi:hypothetical protein
MGGKAWGRKMVGLVAAIALAAGCSRPVLPARDATTAPAPGVAEPQAAEAPAAPATSATEAPAAPATSAGDASTPPYQAGTPEASAAEGTNTRRDPHRTRRVVGWISLAIGAEAAVIATVTSILIEHQKSLRDDNCNAQKVCNAEGFGAVGTISTLIPWNTTTWFVAAAGLGLGTVLLLVSQPESEKQTAITVSPVSSGLGLGVRTTF